MAYSYVCCFLCGDPYESHLVQEMTAGLLEGAY